LLLGLPGIVGGVNVLAVRLSSDGSK